MVAILLHYWYSINIIKIKKKEGIKHEIIESVSCRCNSRMNCVSNQSGKSERRRMDTTYSRTN